MARLFCFSKTKQKNAFEPGKPGNNSKKKKLLGGFFVQKQKFNDDKFVDLNFVISLLHKKELKCFYCRESVYLFYNFVRENKQCTLERIDNNVGHNTDNVEIACLLCNLRRRTMYHERYVFTKQMNIVKLDS